MITLHHDKQHGPAAYHYMLGNHAGAVFNAKNKSEFFAALDKFKRDFGSSYYPKIDENLVLSDVSQKFIDKHG